MDTPTPVVPVTPSATPNTPTAAEPKVVEPAKTDGVSPNGSEPKTPEGESKAPEVTSSGDANKPYKLKINGQEKNLTLEELQNWAQKGLGADEKFQEASRMRGQTQKIIKMIKENPRAILEDPRIGVDLKKLAEEILWEQIEREKMTPEQRELSETKKKLADFEKKEKENTSKAEKEKHRQLTEHFSNEFSKDIQSALEASKVPKTQFTVKRMAFFMQEALKRGVELKAKDVIGIVHDEYLETVKHISSNLDGESLVNLLGEETLKKIREHELKRLQGDGSKPTKLEVLDGNTPPRSGAGSSSVKKMTPDEWKKDLDTRFGT